MQIVHIVFAVCTLRIVQPYVPYILYRTFCYHTVLGIRTRGALVRAWGALSGYVLGVHSQDDPAHAALLVGTVSGVFVLHPDEKQWVRLGDCTAFPLVLVAGLSYQELSDTVVAATMGRGVYVIHGASHALAAALENHNRLVV